MYIKQIKSFFRFTIEAILIAAIFIVAHHYKKMLPHYALDPKDMPEYLKGIITADNFKTTDFPAIGSEEHKQDFTKLHVWQNKRTEEQCHAAYGQRHAKIQEFYPEYTFFFDDLSNKDLVFIYGIVQETNKIIELKKNHYARPRPFNADLTLEPCPEIGRIGDYAYPSGHSVLAGMFEGIMIAIDPENSDKIKEHAWQACVNRVIAGVHHPSDIQAGYALGHEIFKEFAKNKDFTDRLEKLHKRYIRQSKIRKIIQNSGLGFILDKL